MQSADAMPKHTGLRVSPAGRVRYLSQYGAALDMLLVWRITVAPQLTVFYGNFMEIAAKNAVNCTAIKGNYMV